MPAHTPAEKAKNVRNIGSSNSSNATAVPGVRQTIGKSRMITANRQPVDMDPGI